MKLTTLLCCFKHPNSFVGDDDALCASNINTSSTSIGSSTKPVKVAKPSKSLPEPEPYTAVAADALFTKYADEDDPSVIGPEGLERMCSDAEISLEGALPLLLAWQFGASEMAKLSKSEWSKGTSQLQ
jgi:DCN1-like protein 4/5